MYHVPTLKRPRGRPLLGWWGASFLGGSLAGGLLFFSAWWVPDMDLILMADLGWILSATGVGIGQSLVFRAGQVSRPGWIGVSVLGASSVVGTVRLVRWITQTDRSSTGSVQQVVVSAVIGMLVLGLCQAVYLRRHYRRTSWWVGAAVLGGLSMPVIELGLVPLLLPPAVTSAGQGMLLWAIQNGLRWLSLTAWMGVVLVALLQPRNRAAVLAPRAASNSAVQDELPLTE